MTLVGQQPPSPPGQPPVGQPPAEPPVAPPPQGPGVFPPFPAPPVEGRGRRIGIGLGIGAGVLVLACGGGVAAVAGLGQVMTSALNEQAEVVVGDYLTALRDREWSQAYDQLCDRARQDENESQFTSRVSTAERITAWNVGNVDMVRLAAPVSATYADGDTAELRAFLGQNRETGGFEVCSVEE